ncbi:MAG: hypothetical protein AAB941_02670 [Patescibacteria group bacterium]
MKFELEDYHHGVTNDELIADLKQIALGLNKKAISHPRHQELRDKIVII